MKIALLLFGEIRNFDLAVKSWNLLKYPNIDCFILSQNESIELQKGILVRHIKDIDDEYFSSYFPSIEEIKLENRDDFRKNNSHNDLHYMLRDYRNFNKILDNSKKKYDLIFINRLDSIMFINNLDEFFKTYDKNNLYLVNNINKNNPWTRDHFMFGSYNVVKYFLENLPPGNTIVDSHIDLAKYILQIPYTHSIWKDGCVSFHLRHKSYNELKNKFNEYHSGNIKDEIFYDFLKEYETDVVPKIEATVKTINVLVVGESCDDIFIYGDVKRLSPEAPVPVFQKTHNTVNKGMAHNVVNNLQNLGVNTSFITNTEAITKTRFIDESYNHMFLRVDDDCKLVKINLSQLPDQTWDVEGERLYCIDAVVISDYNKGFLLTEDIEYICNSYSIPIFLDTKKKLGNWVKNVSYLKINYQEYLNNKTFFEENPDILEKTIITKGKYGCEFNGNIYSTKKVEVKDVVGAGDTFLAGLVFKYIQTNDIDESIKFANICSTNVVQKRGVAVINPNELENE